MRGDVLRKATIVLSALILVFPGLNARSPRDHDSLAVAGTGSDPAPGLDVSNYRVSYFYGRDEADWITDVPASEAVLRRAAQDAAGSLVLAYASWLGGRGDDWGIAIAANATGIYIAGMTVSRDFPPASVSAPRRDAFVTKLSADGKSLIYTDFFPVGLQPIGKYLGLAVDEKGSVYLAGNTNSRTFPVKNAFQPTLGGGLDGFILKIFPSGKGLVYSTYLGGTSIDIASDVRVDAAGSALVLGQTRSAGFPVRNAYQAAMKGSSDAFLAVFSADGKKLLLSTFLGGAYSEIGMGLSLDSEGGVFLTGLTESPDFPTAGPFQAKYAALYDAFVVKFRRGED
jgi:hypothetical protein